MKLVYIASPYAGDIEKNVEFAKQACRYCIDQGNTPLAVLTSCIRRFLMTASLRKERRG